VKIAQIPEVSRKVIRKSQASTPDQNLKLLKIHFQHSFFGMWRGNRQAP
jgi:hypothetical protein